MQQFQKCCHRDLLIYQLVRDTTRHKLFLQLKREGQAVLKHVELTESWHISDLAPRRL